jgi:photosystem II stability/assembly factor-like uncharacterized protein
VVGVDVENGVVWAVSCPQQATRHAPFGCHPELWRTRGAGGSWTRATLPPTTAQDAEVVRFAATPGDLMLAFPQASARATGELLISLDAGLHWMKQRAPDWDHTGCFIVAGLVAYPPSSFWLLCIGGAAAGSSTKGLLRTTDGGGHWTTVSEVTSLAERPPPGSIPSEEPGALAAGSQTRLWLSLTNGLAESGDGGRRWSGVPQAFDPSGASTEIDVLNADHAWLLAPGAGLWRTTDGVRWSAVGPLNGG